MKLAYFGVEHWLNPMDSKAKYNFGSSCVKALTMDELFRVTGQDEKEFLKFVETMSLHYHHGDSTGSPRVKEAVCGLYPNGNVTPDQVIMTIGGTGANDMVIMTILEKGDNCVVVKPSYQQHYDIPKGMGIETRIVQLKAEDEYMLNPEDLRAQCDADTKMIILTNPNNPTGATLNKEQLQKVVDIAKEFDAWILCDEVYRGLDENLLTSIVDFGYDKAISLSSVSKMFSMAGTRIGWVICKDPDMYFEMVNRRSYNTICCGIFDEVVASIAMENYKKVWERSRSILLPNKKMVYDWAAAEPHVAIHGDAMGTTCLVSYDYDMDSTSMAIDMMEKDRILVTHGACFDMENTFRLGYGAFTDRNWLEEGLEHLSAYLKTLEK